MYNSQASEQTHQKVELFAKKILFWVPLAALPIITNLKIDFFTDATVTPKWAAFLFAWLLTGIALSASIYFGGLQKRAETLLGSIPKLAPTLALAFFSLIGAGILISINWAEGINRFTYWLGGFGFWLATLICILQSQPSYTLWLQRSITLTSAVLGGWFWKIFLIDFKDPTYDRLVNFSSVGHFNFTADVLVFLIPLLTWTLITGRGAILRIVALLSLSTGLFMLLTSGSLGAMGGLALGGIPPLILVLLRRKKQAKATSTPKTSQWLTPLILLLLVTGSMTAWEYIPENYRTGMFQRATWWKAPDESALNQDASDLPPLSGLWLQLAPFLGARTPMWAAATGMTLEHPWLGHGTGSFMYEYPAFEKRYRLFFDDETHGHSIRTNPHNLFLEISTENGIPAALLFHMGYFWLLVRLARKAIKQPESLWLCGLWLAIAALIDAEFNQVFFNPASLFLGALSLGLISGNLALSNAQTPGPESPTRPFKFLIALATLLLTSIPIYFTTLWFCSNAHVAQARRMAQNQETRANEIYSEWAKAYECSNMNPEALYGLADFYSSRGEARKADIAMGEFLKLAPHQSNALNFAASIKSRLKKYDEARDLLLRAQSLEPDTKIIQDNLMAIEKARAEQ